MAARAGYGTGTDVQNNLALGPSAARVVYLLLFFGSFANWATTTATGILGTSKATPIAGAGHGAGLLAENAVLGVLVLVSLAMVAASCAMIYCLCRPAAPRPAGTWDEALSATLPPPQSRRAGTEHWFVR